MSKINALCVYCGSSPGTDPAFAAAARALGKILAENGVRLIFGGGSVGIMGTLAEAVLKHGGEVTGIIPDFLVRRERPEQNGIAQIIVPDMHVRKRKMFEMADGFVALPGGIGTLEELVEQLTWVQLGRHKKPILIANIKGYWDPLLTLIEHMRAVQFVPAALSVNFLVAKDVEEILPKLRDAAREKARTRNPYSLTRDYGFRTCRGACHRTARLRAGPLAPMRNNRLTPLHPSKTSPPRCGCHRDRE